MTKSGQLSRRVGVNKLKSMYKVFVSPLQLIGSCRVKQSKAHQVLRVCWQMLMADKENNSERELEGKSG